MFWNIDRDFLNLCCHKIIEDDINLNKGKQAICLISFEILMVWFNFYLCLVSKAVTWHHTNFTTFYDILKRKGKKTISKNLLVWLTWIETFTLILSMMEHFKPHQGGDDSSPSKFLVLQGILDFSKWLFHVCISQGSCNFAITDCIISTT